MKIIAGITIAVGLALVWLLAVSDVALASNWKLNPAMDRFGRAVSGFERSPSGDPRTEESEVSNESDAGDKEESSPDNAASSPGATDPAPGRDVIRRFPYPSALMELGALLWFLKLVANLLLVALAVLLGTYLAMFAQLSASERPASGRPEPSLHINIEEGPHIDPADTRVIAFTEGAAAPGAAELI